MSDQKENSSTSNGKLSPGLNSDQGRLEKTDQGQRGVIIPRDSMPPLKKPKK